MKKETLAGLAGLFDPALRKSAQRMAGKLSPDNPLRSQLVEAVLGAIKGFVEVNAEKLSPFASVLVEKTTDYLDFMAGAAGGGKTVGEADIEWQTRFLAESTERLKKAEDPQKEAERIKLELELQRQIREVFWKEFKPTETNPEPSALIPAIKDLNSQLERLKTNVENWSKKRS